jgi:hypothetical protein
VANTLVRARLKSNHVSLRFSIDVFATIHILMLNLIISCFLEFLTCLCLIIICMWYKLIIYVNLDGRVLSIIE